MNRAGMNKLVQDNLKTMRDLYLKKNMTAKQIAGIFNIYYDSQFNACLARYVGSKNLGHGGARQNAGNKKGVQFCSVCGKAKNCKC